MSLLLTIPNELIDLICHQLDNDTHLAAFSLVNHQLHDVVNQQLYCLNQQLRDNSALIWAGRYGKHETLRVALAAGLSFDDGRILRAAVMAGHDTIVALLFHHSAILKDSINTIAQDGHTHLFEAAHYGRFETVKVLLANGADPLVRCDRHALMVEDSDYDVGEEDGYDADMVLNLSPINAAASRGFSAIVNLLIEHCPCAKVDDGGTRWPPICIAAASGHLEVVKVLLNHGVQVDSVTWIDAPALHLAADKGHADIVKLLLERGADVHRRASNHRTALHGAALSSKIDSCRLLLDHGANVNVSTPFGFVPLHVAAMRGNCDTIRLLHARGADISAVTGNGRMALHFAVEYGRYRAVRTLLDIGANPNAPGRGGWLPLHYAALQNELEIIEALVEKGADISASAQWGKTPLHIAAQNGQLDSVKLLLELGAPAMAITCSGSTPAHIAAMRGERSTLELLMQIPEIDIVRPDNNGRSPLFYAAMCGHTHIINLFTAEYESSSSNNSQTTASIEIGNVPDTFGALPVFVAVRNGFEPATQALLAFDSTTAIQHKDMFNRNLVWWARKSGKASLAKLVESYANALGVGSLPNDTELAVQPVWSYHGCWCEVCCKTENGVTSHYSCQICDDGNFIVCRECYDAGARCRNSDHVVEWNRCRASEA